eukprot:EG_transcript_2444
MTQNAGGRTAQSAPSRAASRSRTFSEQLPSADAPDLVTIPAQELHRLQERLKVQDGTLALLRGQLRNSQAPSSSRLLGLASQQQQQQQEQQQAGRRVAAPPYEAARPLKEVQEAERAQRVLELSAEVAQHRDEVLRVRQQLAAVSQGPPAGPQGLAAAPQGPPKRSFRIWVVEMSHFQGNWTPGEGIYLCFSAAHLAETTSCRPAEPTVQWNEEVTLELDAAADVGLQVLHGDTRETLSAASIDAAVLEGLGNGPVQHQLLAASGNADRVVQVSLLLEELCPQCLRTLGGAADPNGGELPFPSGSPSRTPPPAGRASPRGPEPGTSPRGPEPGTRAVDGRLELALQALRDNEPQLMRLVRDGQVDGGVLAAFQNLHEALWQLRGAPLERSADRPPAPAYAAAAAAAEAPPAAIVALEAELRGTQAEVRQREVDLRRLQAEHGVETQTLEKAVVQLRAVVAEQTAGMQQTLLANGRLQEEVARLRGLLQQREAQALLSDEAAGQQTSTLEADVARLKKELDSARRLDNSKDLELGSLRSLLGVRDASAEAMSRQLQAAEETARELEQELRRKEQELQQKDAEAAAAARAADSRRQGSPVRGASAAKGTDPATQQRLQEAMADLARAKQHMAMMEEELVRASGEIRSLRDALLAVKRRPSKERDGSFPYFGLELADGVRFARGLAGTFKYGSIKVVQAWGPASSAGVLPLDFLKAVNGQPVASLADMRRLSLALAPGAVVDLLVERGDEELQCTVQTLTSRTAPGSNVRTNVVLARVVHEDGTEQDRMVSPIPGPADYGDRTFFS